MTTRRLIWCFTLLAAVACGKQNDTAPLEEVIDRLRVIGVAPSPLVPQLVQTATATSTAKDSTATATATATTTATDTDTATTVTLTVYAAIPSGQDVSLTAATISSGSVKISASDMQIGTATYQEHNGFRLVTIPVTVQVPNLSAFKSSSSKASSSSSTATGTGTGTDTSTASSTDTSAGSSTSTGTATATNGAGGDVSYAFLVSGGGRTVEADGLFLAREAGSADLSIAAPILNITAPSAGATLDATGSDLTLSYTEADGESVVVGWFVSDGTVVNRRDETTHWTPDHGGGHSIIGTVRSSRSFGFAAQVIDVDSE